MTKEELETIINFNETPELADIETPNQTLKRKLAEYAKEYPDQVKFLGSVDEFDRYLVPKKWIKVKPPRKMTEEQRAAAIERAKINFGK